MLRRREDGKVPALEIQVDGARIGDLLAALDRGGLRGEESVHFCRRPHVELVGAVAQTVLVSAGLAGVDAQQHIMGGTIGLAEIMGVAGGDERQPEPVGDVDGAFGAAFLQVEAVVLDLDVEVLAEEPSKPFGECGGFLDLVL